MNEQSIIIRWDKNSDGSTDISVSGDIGGQTHFREAFLSLDMLPPLYDISETKTSGEYVRITLAEVRKRIESKGISEEEMRKSVYQDNPQYKKPDKGIERIIHRLLLLSAKKIEAGET